MSDLDEAAAADYLRHLERSLVDLPPAPVPDLLVRGRSRRRARRRLGLVGAGVAVAMTVGGLAGFATTDDDRTDRTPALVPPGPAPEPRTKSVRVPDVRGKRPAVAQRRLAEKGIESEIIGELGDHPLRDIWVVGQEPARGERVAPDEPVVLRVAYVVARDVVIRNESGRAVWIRILDNFLGGAHVRDGAQVRVGANGFCRFGAVAVYTEIGELIETLEPPCDVSEWVIEPDPDLTPYTPVPLRAERLVRLADHGRSFSTGERAFALCRSEDGQSIYVRERRGFAGFTLPEDPANTAFDRPVAEVAPLLPTCFMTVDQTLSP